MRADLAVLPDRALIEVTGPEARDFLQRLITNDVETLEPGQARYAALLTPQGKIITDFFVVAVSNESFLLDVPAVNASDLIKKLTLYRLRAKVVIADRSQDYAVVAFLGVPPDAKLVLTYADPRSDGLWSRAVIGREGVGSLDSPEGRRAYDEERIRAGVPEGGLDFAYGDTFPHEANLDRLHGVDFRKGCYVGQEVVSRVEHRGTARKRIVKASFAGSPPPVGTEIQAAGLAIGTMGSSIDGVGLAMIRLDRASDAGDGLRAGDVSLTID